MQEEYQDCSEPNQEVLASIAKYLASVDTLCSLVCIAFGIITILVIPIGGIRWFAQHFYIWATIGLSLFTFILVPLSLILALFKRSRALGGVGFCVSSYPVGLWLWLWSLIITASMAGIGWLIIGLFIFGVGTIPIAFVILLLHAKWAAAGYMFLMFASFSVLHLIGTGLTYSRKNRKTKILSD